jgi:holo-[acyl-carrier protein] synthase
MVPPPRCANRCGIDSVELSRIARFLMETPPADIARLFSAQELADAGDGPGRIASLAARFAAKEACLKLFPTETARQKIAQSDFSVARDVNGAPRVVLSRHAQDVAARHRIERIELSLTHDRSHASAVALAVPARTVVPLAGKLFYHLLPVRRDIVLANLRRVYGDTVEDAELVRLAQAHYARPLRLIGEFIRLRFMSRDDGRRGHRT